MASNSPRSIVNIRIENSSLSPCGKFRREGSSLGVPEHTTGLSLWVSANAGGILKAASTPTPIPGAFVDLEQSQQSLEQSWEVYQLSVQVLNQRLWETAR